MMKIKKLDDRGLTLVQLLIASALTVLLVVMISRISSSLLKGQISGEKKVQSDDNALLLVQSIMQHGRLARTCTWLNSGTPLSCYIDKNVPPIVEGAASPTLTRVDFVLNAPLKIVYQREYLGAALQKEIQYPNIVGFTVCSTTSGACSLSPNKMNPVSSRFFRFLIRSQPTTSAQNAIAISDHQSAFFVRHPTPRYSNVVYQWGAK